MRLPSSLPSELLFSGPIHYTARRPMRLDIPVPGARTQYHNSRLQLPNDRLLHDGPCQTPWPCRPLPETPHYRHARLKGPIP